MSSLKKLAGQTAIYGLSSIVGRLLNYLLVPWYTRIFTQAEYGVVTDLYAYTVLFIILLTYGMETAFFNFSRKFPSNNNVFRTTIVSLFTSSLFFVLIISIFSNPIAGAMGYTDYSYYIIWFAIIVAADAFTSIPFAKLRLENKALTFASIKLLSILLNISFNLFFIVWFPLLLESGYFTGAATLYYSFDLVAYVFISNLLVSVIILSVLLPIIIKAKGDFSFSLLGSQLKYGIPLLLAGLAGSINEVADRVLIKYLVKIPETAADAGTYIFSQLGIYGANYKLSIIMVLFVQTFRYAFEPFIFSNASNTGSRELNAAATKYFYIFCLCVFLFVSFNLELFQHFIGPSFRHGLHIVPILLAANIFLGLVFNLSVWYKLAEKTMYGAAVSGFGAIITIITNILLIPQMGYTGAAWATLACYFSMAVFSYLLGQKHYKIPYDLKTMLLYSIFALLIYISWAYFADTLFITNKWVMLTIGNIMFLIFTGYTLLREYKLYTRL
jgi:O-antigen/teichoic acid export membrane protein